MFKAFKYGFLAIVIGAFFPALQAVAADTKQVADTIYHNAFVYTVDGEGSRGY